MKYSQTLVLASVLLLSCSVTASPMAEKGKALGRMSLNEGLHPSVRVMKGCFFNESHCACDLIKPPAGSKKCYTKLGDLNNGMIKCSPRDCEGSYVCYCDGKHLCKRDVVDVPVIRLLDGTTDTCTRTIRTTNKSIVIEGAAVPDETKTEGELTAFNQTHCTCSPKVSLVGPMTCLDHVPNAAVGSDGKTQCTTRDCRVNPNDMLCDLEGKSLCERQMIEKESYINDGPVPGDNAGEKTVVCHQERRTVEAAVCVSSCPY